jgi:lipase maturation factor 1
LTWLFQNSNNSKVLATISRLVGLVYLIAFVPMLFELVPLVGQNGLQPANDLLKIAYKSEGAFSFIRFPSLYWFLPKDIFLYLLVCIGIGSGLALLIGFQPIVFSFFAWLSFTSICTIGGDFYIIIIDLFLSEVGFLFFLVHLSKSWLGYVTNLASFSITFLNFRLWFSMGVIKFFCAHDIWKNGSFFHYFFPNQPMPTPLAYYAAQLPQWMFWTAQAWLFIVQIIMPFFVFGNKYFRWIAMLNFIAMSIAIMLVGNYGYFNLLSIVLALALIKDDDLKNYTKANLQVIPQKPWRVKLLSIIIIPPLLLQFFYTIALFDTNPPGYQNHFNHVFLYQNWQKGWKGIVSTCAKPFVFLRITNPYGVFKSMPKYRNELRFSGSMDRIEWKPYVFKYAPTAQRNHLKWFAPYYPRLDHLLFYESINAGGYRFNLLNPYYTTNNVWTCRFVDALKTDQKDILSLLANYPFHNSPPVFIRCEVYSLDFDYQKGLWHSKLTALLLQQKPKCRPLLDSLDQ